MRHSRRPARRIASEIRRLVGEVTMAKPLPTGALLIKTKPPDQAIDLLKTEEFLGRPVILLPGDWHNTVEAIAFVKL